MPMSPMSVVPAVVIEVPSDVQCHAERYSNLFSACSYIKHLVPGNRTNYFFKGKQSVMQKISIPYQDADTSFVQICCAMLDN